MSGMKGARDIDLMQGEAFTLEPASAHASVVTNQAGVYTFIVQGERPRLVFWLGLTAAATAAGDTLDAYIDVLAPDGVSWVNGAHYPQMIGTGGAKAYAAIFDPSNPGTACIDLSADCAVNTVRPALFGPQYRFRYTVVQVTGASFTFSVVCYAVGAGAP